MYFTPTTTKNYGASVRTEIQTDRIELRVQK